MSRYLAITPARDEERLLPGLIASMVAQDNRPERWIVIDDGSTDNTGPLIDETASRHGWVRAAHRPPGSSRAEGGESVTARILSEERWSEYDFLLRLDADLTFDSDFAGRLIREFASDHRLGIAGPVLLEPDSGGWRMVKQPRFHTRGAAKMYSRACLSAIGLPDSGLGWDTLDEVAAMMAGFRTRHFLDIRARHHRPQGAAGGIWKARRAAGVAAYRIGYSPLFIAARAMRLCFGSAGPLGAIALLAGFLDGYRKALRRPVTPELMAFVRRQQVRRLMMQETLWR